MQRFTNPLAIGSALLAAAMLAACGGGSSSSASLPSTSGGPNTQSQKPGAHVTIVINRAPAPVSMVRIGKTIKRREYVSASAAGLQISVAQPGSGNPPQMVYADISSSSTLCTKSGTLETCTITIPTLGASETIAATELDQIPTGDANGYGTGFPHGSNILAVGSTTASITLGSATNNVALLLDPVAAVINDGGPTTGGSNFGEDTGNRLVETGGELAAQGVAVYGLDAANPTQDNIKNEPSPLPYVDVNGSPEPISITVSQSAGVTVATNVPGGNPPPTYGSTASIPNVSYVWPGWEWAIGIEGSTAFTSPATITISNNLSALNPFTGNSYATTLTYTIVPVTVSPTSATLSLSAGTPVTVTGTDPLAPAPGMNAESAYQMNDGECFDMNNPQQEDAKIAAGTFSTTSYMQSFTITPLATGQCTFVLYDVDTGVVTQAVNVNVES